MTGIGNSEQTRIVAEQLFAVWEEKQRRAEKESRRWWQSNASGWVAMFVLAVGAIAAASNIQNIASAADARSIKNERDIDEMRVVNADRLARIETKVDRLLEDKP